MNNHVWVQSQATGGPFLSFSTLTRIARWEEWCSCGAHRTGTLYEQGVVSYYPDHGPCPGPLPVHSCYYLAGPPKPGYPLGLERCTCGSTRQPTRRGGYRHPSVAEIRRYQSTPLPSH